MRISKVPFSTKVILDLVHEREKNKKQWQSKRKEQIDEKDLITLYSGAVCNDRNIDIRV